MKRRWWQILFGALALAGCVMPPDERLRPAMADHTFDLINDERRQADLRLLVRREDLDQVARRHALDQAAHDELNHRGSDGLLVEGRFDQARIDWVEAGENVARNKGYTAPEVEAVRGWLASPAHRANILSARFRETGLAVAYSPKNGYYYFTQVFLLRMPEEP